jgi:nitrogen fixation protein FixH
MRPLAILFTFGLSALAADWQIAHLVPKTAKANFDTALTITVKDGKGAPVAGAEVEAILTMVDMDHGEFKSVAKQVKPGVYQAKTKFIMVGAWQIEVKAKKGADMAGAKFRHEINE